MVHKVGERVCSGRFPGANSLGWPGISEKPEPRSCKKNPAEPAPMVEPMPWKFDWIKEMPSPDVSRTQR